MEDNSKLIEPLLERAVEYGKSSFELIKLKALEKTSDIVSSIIPHSFVFILIASFLVFFNLGIAFWLGEILGKTFLGFFIVAGFYIIAGIVIRFVIYKWIKKYIRNYIIKLLFK